MYVSTEGQSRMGTEAGERRCRVESGMWECMIGIERVRSVPLEERIVIWTGEKALQIMRVSVYLDHGSFGISGGICILV